jgi:hypothetical protein
MRGAKGAVLQHHDNDAKCANHVDADAAADDAVINNTSSPETSTNSLL